MPADTAPVPTPTGIVALDPPAGSLLPTRIAAAATAQAPTRSVVTKPAPTPAEPANCALPRALRQPVTPAPDTPPQPPPRLLV